MTDEFDPDEFLSGLGIDSEEQPGDGTALKALRKQLKTLSKDLKSEREKTAAFEQEKTKTALASTWDELKVPEKIRALYTGEQNAEAVKAWATEYKDVFNLSAESTDTPGTPPENQDLLGFQQASDLGSDPARISMDTIQEELGKVKGLSAQRNPDALDEALAKLGIRAGSLTPPTVE